MTRSVRGRGIGMASFFSRFALARAETRHEFAVHDNGAGQQACSRRIRKAQEASPPARTGHAEASGDDRSLTALRSRAPVRGYLGPGGGLVRMGTIQPGRAEAAEPIQGFLQPLRTAHRRCSAVRPGPGAVWSPSSAGGGIGGIATGPSLERWRGSHGSPCLFRLRRRQGAGWERVSFTAEPRAGYVLKGDVRTGWEHSIPPVDSLRWSVTFRTLKRRPG